MRCGSGTRFDNLGSPVYWRRCLRLGGARNRFRRASVPKATSGASSGRDSAGLTRFLEAGMGLSQALAQLAAERRCRLRFRLLGRFSV